MQFQVEEDRQAQLGHLVHAMVAVGIEELQPQLHPADMATHLAGQCHRRIQPGQIQRDKDRVVIHGVGSLKLKSVAGGVRQ